MAGRYPTPDADVADYKGGVQSAFNTTETIIASTGEIPVSLLENVAPLVPGIRVE